MSPCARTHNACRTSLLPSVWLDLLGPHLSILRRIVCRSERRKYIRKDTRVIYERYTANQSGRLSGSWQMRQLKTIVEINKDALFESMTSGGKGAQNDRCLENNGVGSSVAVTLLHSSVCAHCWNHAAALGRVHHFLNLLSMTTKKNSKHVLWQKEQNDLIRNEQKENSEKQK